MYIMGGKLDVDQHIRICHQTRGGTAFTITKAEKGSFLKKKNYDTFYYLNNM